MGIQGDGMLLHTVYRIALVLAAAPLAYYLLSLYCVVDYFHELRKSPPLNSEYLPPVSILKPVRGVDREAYENFASYCRLDYPEYEIIFAVDRKSTRLNSSHVSISYAVFCLKK